VATTVHMFPACAGGAVISGPCAPENFPPTSIMILDIILHTYPGSKFKRPCVWLINPVVSLHALRGACDPTAQCAKTVQRYLAWMMPRSSETCIVLLILPPCICHGH
jgi:hypothetical protein